MNPSWRQIATEVAQAHGLTMDDLIGRCNFKKHVVARHEAISLVRASTRLSTTAIGQRFGGRDHTTVLYAVKAHERRSACS